MLEFLNNLFWVNAKTDQEDAQENEITKFELTPLDQFSVSFIQIDVKPQPNFWLSIVGPKLQDAIPSISNTIKSIQSKIDNLHKTKPKYLIRPNFSEVSNPQIRTKKEFQITDTMRWYWIYMDLYNQSLDSISNTQIDINRQALFYCNQMLEFIQNVIDREYSIQVDYTGFIQKINDFTSPKTNQSIIKQVKLSKSLYNLVSIHNPKSEAPNVSRIPTAKQTFNSLKSVLHLFDKYSKYIGWSDFDTTFELYITNDSNIMERYEKIMNKMSLFEYPQAINELFELTGSIAATLGVNFISEVDKVQTTNIENDAFWIIYYASTRYFFNQVCIQLPYLLSNDLSISAFIKNCDFIQHRTPTQLKAVPHVFLPSQMNLTVEEIFTKNPRLNKALEYLSMAQFLNSPLDLAMVVNKAIEIFNIEIYLNMYKNKTCNSDPNAQVPGININENGEFIGFRSLNEQDETIGHSSDLMTAFDDLFTFFYMALAMQPPPNAQAVRVFLQAFGSFGQSQQIDYASTTLQAGIDYICNYKFSE